MYGVEVSPPLVSEVTDAVMDEVKTWQGRPLGALYPVVDMDAVRDGGQVQNRAMHAAIGIGMNRCKQVLGLWVTATEGAKFWLQRSTI
jgi:putative transposase